MIGVNFDKEAISVKKTISSVLAVLIVLLSVVNCFGVSAKGEFEYEKLDSGNITITAYNGDGKNVVVPSEIDGKKVVSISENVFSCNKKIKDVKIGEGIETIGKNAFNNCIYLENVTFPSSLKSIGENAFFTCTSLKSVTFPGNLEEIGTGSFFGCNGLSEVSLPSGLKSVGDYAFAFCSSLESVKISEGLTKLSNQMFASCQKLKSVVLPESVSIIGRKAFIEDSELSSVNLPKNLELVDEKAFSACFNLNLSTINARVIRESAFSGVKFDELILGNRVETMENDAFDSGDYESIYISKSVTSLSAYSFDSPSLKNITVDKDNPSYKDIDGVLFSKDESVLIKYPRANDNAGAEYKIPSTVKIIEKAAFRSCSELPGVVIPDGVEKIKDNCFEYCSMFESVTVPDSVTYLGESAFSSCSSLASVKLPENLESISDSAFSECYGLKNVELGSNVKTIENGAFSFCDSLESIKIPKSVEYFNSSAFSPCESLSNIEIEDGSSLVFCDNAVMNREKTELFAYFGKEESYTVPESVKTIGELAIMSGTLTQVTIPESVETFGKYSVGYYISFGENPYEQVGGFRIFGKEGSKAQEYAKENHIAFYTAEPQANAEKITLKAGETYDFTVNGSVASNTEYASSNSKIAYVDKNGKVTAMKNGKAEIFAVIGGEKFRLLVTVIGGEDFVDTYSSYKTVKTEEVEAWSKDYFAYNDTESISVGEYYNTNLYTSELYIPIMAHIVGGSYEEAAKKAYGEDYGQYKQVGDNLKDELSRMKLHENTVLFSGTDDISYITHSSSSITDMVSSIGTTHTYEGVISTSISHSVAASFGTGMMHTMLEIYADKDSSDGVYIAGVSYHPDEYELLLNRDLKYEVIDAGIRTVTLANRFGGEPEEFVERFIKLRIIGREQQEEDESAITVMLKAFMKMLKSAYSLLEIILKLICQIVK